MRPYDWARLAALAVIWSLQCPTRSLSTGLAAPALGVLWGWLLLDESVTLAMLVGIALVVSALFLVLRR